MAPIGSNDKSIFRVFITGFGPFRGLPNNPSWLAVKRLHNLSVPPAPAGNRKNKKTLKTIHISTFEVPVLYEEVLSIIPNLHQSPPILPDSLRDDPSLPPPPERGYDLILHVGLGDVQPLRLERLGHKTNYTLPDIQWQLAPLINQNSGVRGFGKGYEQFGEELKAIVDVDALVSEVTAGKDGLKMIISDDPGRYLCDFIYYASLAQAQKSSEESGKKAIPVLFLHCSPVGNPSSTEDVVAGITRIVQWVAKSNS